MIVLTLAICLTGDAAADADAKAVVAVAMALNAAPTGKVCKACDKCDCDTCKCGDRPCKECGDKCKCKGCGCGPRPLPKAPDPLTECLCKTGCGCPGRRGLLCKCKDFAAREPSQPCEFCKGHCDCVNCGCDEYYSRKAAVSSPAVWPTTAPLFVPAPPRQEIAPMSVRQTQYAPRVRTITPAPVQTPRPAPAPAPARQSFVPAPVIRPMIRPAARQSGNC